MANNTAQQKYIKALSSAELISIGGVIVGVALDKLNMGVAIVLTIALSSLAMVFMLNAFVVHKPLEEEQKSFLSLLSGSILPKVLWINSAVAAIGILFYLNAFEGSERLLNIAFINYCVLIVILVLLKMVNAITEGLMEPLKRALPLFLICSYFLFF